MPSPHLFAFRRETTGLMLLFAAMYFVQGVAEPTEGLISQPVRSLLRTWGHSTTEIATFSAILALPWSLKLLYGLLTDFVPFAGTRRRSYLLLTTSLTIAALGYLYLAPPQPGADLRLLLLLLIPTVGVAFSDVVVDALMIEKGQPRGLTGRLQSVQWAAMYTATILAGVLGGYLSQRHQQELSFLICAGLTTVTLVLTWAFVQEKPLPRAACRPRKALDALLITVTDPSVLMAAAFLFLWSFNPFNQSVLYVYTIGQLGLSEQFYGTTVSLLSVGAVLASVAYGSYCRSVPFIWLIHGSIVAGILSTLAYWGLRGQISAAVVNLVVGFTYMTGNLVLLDLAARSCPLATAGTTFAMLMGLSNLSLSLSTALGGWLYDHWSRQWSPTAAFNLLVLVGALTTAACWLLLPLIKRELPVEQAAHSEARAKNDA